MDTMEITKIFGAVCGALLVYLMVNWVAEEMYHVGGDGHGDHHGEVKVGYLIEVEGDEDVAEAEEEETGPTVEELLASADIGKGEKVFNKCKSCHKLEDGANGTGPHLYSIVGRELAVVDGFGYSSAMADKGGDWDVAALDGFLANPKGWLPGTKMSFAGLKKVEDRANLIAYLQTSGN